MSLDGEKAVVLLSGGLDSAVSAAIARSEGFELVALTVDYGQRHRRELESASKIAAALGARHEVVRIDWNLAGSALTDRDVDVPVDRDPERSGIPVTYVPMRNLVFLSIASSYAESVGAGHVFIGVNAIDYSGYPDCRPEFVHSFQETSALASKAGVEGKRIEIHAPLIRMSKAEIIRKGVELDVPLGLTWSCYEGGEKACGRCDSCQLRLRGFREAGLDDPVPYENV